MEDLSPGARETNHSEAEDGETSGCQRGHRHNGREKARGAKGGVEVPWPGQLSELTACATSIAVALSTYPDTE